MEQFGLCGALWRCYKTKAPLSSDSDSGATASNVLVTGCSNYGRLYYAGNDFASTGQDIFKCVKCSDNKYQSYNISSICLAEGVHAKHNKFLAPHPSDNTGK